MEVRQHNSLTIQGNTPNPHIVGIGIQWGRRLWDQIFMHAQELMRTENREVRSGAVSCELLIPRIAYTAYPTVNLFQMYYKMTKSRPCKNIPSLKFRTLRRFFRQKYSKNTEKRITAGTHFLAIVCHFFVIRHMSSYYLVATTAKGILYCAS